MAFPWVIRVGKALALVEPCIILHKKANLMQYIAIYAKVSQYFFNA